MCPLSAHRRITALTHLIIMATKEYFPGIGKIKFEGKESKNPMAFRYYDAEKVIMGKKMKDWLKFSMAWWHTLCAEGGDQFGSGTTLFPWNGNTDAIQAAKDKMDAGFEFMQKIGIDTTDWERVNNFCLNPRIAGKPFGRLDTEELEQLAVKLRSIERKGGLKVKETEKRQEHEVKQPGRAVYVIIDPNAPKN